MEADTHVRVPGETMEASIPVLGAGNKALQQMKESICRNSFKMGYFCHLYN